MTIWERSMASESKVLIRMPHLGSDITGLLALSVPRIGMVTTDYI